MKIILNKNKLWILLLGCMIGLTGCMSLFGLGIGGIGLMPGRPLRIEGEQVIAAVHLGKESNWAKGERPDCSQLDESTRMALEALWLRDAQGEHASIPAFSRISWQLAMIGAPPELLEWAHKAALEEINHARLCFALAEGYGKRSYSVQPIPEMAESGLDLTNDPITLIATETVFDGCLVEGFFAKAAAVAAAQCEEPAALAALDQIAREEASHTAFSWALLEWLFQEHPSLVKPIIENAHRNLGTHTRPNAISWEQKQLIEKADPELLSKHGRLSDEQWQTIWDDHLVIMEQDLQKLLAPNL